MADPSYRYHEIFLPFNDIYRFSGTEVFERLGAKSEGERNLIVFPSIFSDVLSPEEYGSKQNQSYIDGGEEVVEFIGDLSISDKKLNSNEFLKWINQDFVRSLNRQSPFGVSSIPLLSVFHLANNLDVAYIDYKYLSQDERFSITGLEDFVSKMWTSQQNKRDGRPLLITNKGKHLAKYATRGMHIERPTFFIVGRDIVDRGMIIGTDTLLSRLMSEKSKSLALEDAIDILGNDNLQHNTIVKFLNPSGHPIYGLVDGSIIRAKDGQIIDVEDCKLKLLDEKEYSRKLSISNHQLKNGAIGIHPRDMQQYLAMQHGIFDQSNDITFIVGPHGCGKSLITYAAVMELVLNYDFAIAKKRGYPQDAYHKQNKSLFEKIALFKPNDPLGSRYTGYKKGTQLDKLIGSLRSFEDMHEATDLGEIFPFIDLFLHPEITTPELGGALRSEKGNLKYDKRAALPNGFTFKLYPMEDIRGRSISHALIWIDEAQNFTPFEMKTILGRASIGTRVVVTGDPKQVDNSACSRDFNGLTVVINHFLTKYPFLLNLSRNYRSPVSKHAESMPDYGRR